MNIEKIQNQNSDIRMKINQIVNRIDNKLGITKKLDMDAILSESKLKNMYHSEGRVAN